jgi:hypothetical protein
MHHHPGGSDGLFDPERPLGKFASKIALAHRPGLVDHDVELALQLVRRIRNEFAHSVGSSSLSEAAHASRTRELGRLCGATDVYHSVRRGLATKSLTVEVITFSASLAARVAKIEGTAHHRTVHTNKSRRIEVLGKTTGRKFRA